MTEFQRVYAHYHFAHRRYVRSVDYRANRRWPQRTWWQEDRLRRQMRARRERLTEPYERATAELAPLWDRISRRLAPFGDDEQYAMTREAYRKSEHDHLRAVHLLIHSHNQLGHGWW